jgi:alanine racemase
MSDSRRFFRPVWADIDLKALETNLRRMRARVGKRPKLLFVVKANAYGHGALACSKLAQQKRLADWLGVSSVEEGIALREGGIKLPILVLGSLYPFESFLAAAEFDLTPTVASLESARRFKDAAKLHPGWKCHVKIETGMNRIGVRPDEGVRVVEYLRSSVEGVYTHFSCADSDRAYTRKQLGIFKDFLKRAPKVKLRHAANSAATLRHPETRFDLVRPGLALYGLSDGFEPVLSLKTRVVFIKNVGPGAAIGYGATHRARKPSRIATLPIGYADGFARRLSNKGEVLIGGRRCPVVGAVSMDMTTVDVTNAPEVRVGDQAAVLGSQGRERISAGDLAGLLGTIPYEIVCGVSARVPRKNLS